MNNKSIIFVKLFNSASEDKGETQQPNFKTSKRHRSSIFDPFRTMIGGNSNFKNSNQNTPLQKKEFKDDVDQIKLEIISQKGDETKEETGKPGSNEGNTFTNNLRNNSDEDNSNNTPMFHEKGGDAYPFPKNEEKEEIKSTFARFFGRLFGKKDQDDSLESVGEEGVKTSVIPNFVKGIIKVGEIQTRNMEEIENSLQDEDDEEPRSEYLSELDIPMEGEKYIIKQKETKGGKEIRNSPLKKQKSKLIF